MDIMKLYLTNLANIYALAFCKENNIDCSDSHITKQPRKQIYTLVKGLADEPVITVTFYKTSVPTYQIY